MHCRVITTFLGMLLSCVAATALAMDVGLDARPLNLSCVAPAPPASSTVVALEPVLDPADLSFPLELQQAPGDPSRWYVVDRSGVVVVYQNGPTWTREHTFADITDRLTRIFEGAVANEMGLLGMAFHPDFATNGEVFLYYSASGDPLVGRLSRFTTTTGGQMLDPSSEEILVETNREHQWHWGGHMEFGSDGYLYLSLGDGGRHANGQDTSNLLGSLIRIDVDSGETPYGIPADNPFASGGGRPEIYAWGLRNPWRWSFDRESGELWLGDVGDALWEEINVVERGGNYGWSVREGAHCSGLLPCTTQGLIDPVVEYAHDGVAAIIGGHVYRGDGIPTLLGTYVYADLSGGVWALYFDDNGNPDPQLLVDTGETILSIGQGLDGELYVLAMDQIFRLVEPASPGEDNFPQTLSETGCFDPIDVKQPGSALIPYGVNVELFSDGAEKQRWMALPDSTTISIEADGDWKFPVGTLLIKSFALDGKLVETRLLVHHSNGNWGGYSYEWNDEQTDATLLPSGKTKSIDGQTWSYPSRGQCRQCHTLAAGRSLGLETAQLNGVLTYPATGRSANQLDTLNFIGMFDAPLGDSPDNLPSLPDLSDESAPIEERARGYLHANCSMCHRPGGTGQGPEDFRHWIPAHDMHAINVEPTQGTMGVQDAKLLSPGVPQRSIISLRMHALNEFRMPPLATSIVDLQATDVVDRWITSLPVDSNARLGGFTWQDLDGDGIQGTGEPGLAGVPVQLQDCAGEVLGNTTSDAQGSYAFAALPPGDYRLHFTAPPSSVIGPSLRGGNGSLDSDPEPGTGLTQCWSIASSESALDIDAGMVETPLGSFGDFIWKDTNGDGIQELGEPGFAGVIVRLQDCDGNVLATTTSNVNGLYTFWQLIPGSYVIEVIPPPGYRLSPSIRGTSRILDSNPKADTGRTGCMTVGGGVSRLGVDAGLVQAGGPIGSIGDLIWVDSNGDGIQAAGEPRIAGVIVRLQDCSGTVLATTVSSTSGRYGFDGLPPGSYLIEVVPPPGYVLSPDIRGTNRVVDSNPDPETGLTACLTVGGNESRPGVDAGLVPAAGAGSIGDFIWEDANADGLQDAGEPGMAGVTVRLQDCAGNVLASSASDLAGHYAFEGLLPGSYLIEVVPPSGHTLSPSFVGASRVVDSNPDPETGLTGCMTVVGNQSRPGIDAGLVPPVGSGSIGDFIWEDVNGDGLQDAGEPGMAGVTVRLQDCAGNVLANSASDLTGHYAFEGLPSSSYVIEVVPPFGHTLSPSFVGASRVVDSNPNPETGLTGCMTVVGDQSRPGIDAGLVPPVGAGSIGDFIWEDSNGDGLQDAGEPGMSGVTVRLQDCAGNDLASSVSDLAGRYTFEGLPSSSYVIEVVAPLGYVLSPSFVGASRVLDSNPNPETGSTGCMTVVGDQWRPGIDAGLVPSTGTGSIGDFIWEDANGDGLQDAGEPGMSGVTVRLQDCAGNVLANSVSDLAGHYSFDGLPPGDYVIEVVPPLGRRISPSFVGASRSLDSNPSPNSRLTGCMLVEDGRWRPGIDAGIVP